MLWTYLEGPECTNTFLLMASPFYLAMGLGYDPKKG